MKRDTLFRKRVVNARESLAFWTLVDVMLPGNKVYLDGDAISRRRCNADANKVDWRVDTIKTHQGRTEGVNAMQGNAQSPADSSYFVPVAKRGALQHFSKMRNATERTDNRHALTTSVSSSIVWVWMDLKCRSTLNNCQWCSGITNEMSKIKMLQKSSLFLSF